MSSNASVSEQYIKVQCYEGADGLVIRIDTQSTDAFVAIRDVFLNLAGGKTEEIEFLTVNRVVAEGIKSLKLQLVPHETSQTLQLVNRLNDGPEFVWRWHPDGWLDCVWWLNGMLKSDQPGHQYLNNGLDDDATVIVAHRES
jgi:hypothetical protein